MTGECPSSVHLLQSISSNAFAQAATTNGGYYACVTEEYLDDIMKFLIAKDYASADAYSAQNKCVILKAGLQVSIVKVKWTRIQFAYKGLKLWTVSEAINV